MNITADQVKLLREKTGLGMMLCKSALTETNGDMDKAIENLRKQGQATAAKRAGKAAKEGKVSVVADAGCAIMYEVNSETDFVARNDDFISFVNELGTTLLASKPATLADAQKLPLAAFGGQSAESKLSELIGKIGENIAFRRYIRLPFDPARQRVFSYIHGNGKIGIIVLLTVSDSAALAAPALADLGKDCAMQIAASNPIAVGRGNFTAEFLAKEKEIYFSQAQTSGKPEKVWDKIVEGKLDKFFKESALLEQPFIRTPEITVGDRIKEAEKLIGATVTIESFARFELGAELE
ncbi:MAG: translation elongation factor Ts [Chitinivibrionales bacterium]|nr:translation elongation factor Ts [Chitinivibrionales bacterium]